MNLLIKETDLGYLSTQYKDIQFYMLRSDDHLSFISCLVCICKTSNDVIHNWQSIQNMVAVFNQSNANFDAWNMYLAFFSIETVPIWAKYEIENNKFSVRKIVLNELELPPSIDILIIELEKHFFGADLTLTNHSNQREENLEHIGKFYSGVPLDSKNESREKRALVLNNIIKSLSSDEN